MIESLLLLYVPGGIGGTDGVDGLFWNHQRGITEGEIVELSSDRRFFDAQCTAAVTVVVALATLESTVEEHQQRWNIIQVKLFPPGSLAYPLRALSCPV
jgi:hypothetical protein